ncbi:MAG TPA: hypothetical protein VIH90_04190 [Candidatus Saccharimonadales bacterium]
MPIIRVETDKTAELNYSLVYPGSEGSGLITPGASPKTIYLDPELLVVGHEDDWHPEISYLNDALIPDSFGSDRAKIARERAQEEVGNITSPLFFEKLLQVVLEKPNLELKHIFVAVTRHSNDWYHDLGFLATR